MASTIQIFGTKKCSDTNKAIRFFKERNVKTQFVDLNEKGMSKGELESVTKKVPLEQLIDKDGKQFRKRNMKYMVFDLQKELLEDPLLLNTPVTRFGRDASVGYTPEVWKKWLQTQK